MYPDLGLTKPELQPLPLVHLRAVSGEPHPGSSTVWCRVSLCTVGAMKHTCRGGRVWYLVLANGAAVQTYRVQRGYDSCRLHIPLNE